MQELSPDIFRLFYGFTYFVLGLAVVARASAYPSSTFRNRLLALGWFGLLHAASSGLTFLYLYMEVAPFQFRAMLYVPGSLALYYFAFGWNERRPNLAHTIVMASICGLVITSLLVTELELLQALRRLGIAMPATVCAGLVFIYDKSFRFGTKFSDGLRWIVATGFMVYAALYLFLTATDLFPLLSTADGMFGSIAKPATNIVRGAAILAIMVGTLSLLNRFDFSLRRQTENALAISEAKLRKALDVSELGIWEWNVVTKEATYSHHVCKILGVRPQDIKPATSIFILEFVHPGDQAEVRTAIKQILEQGEPFNIDHRIVTPDGAERVVETRGELQCGHNGEPLKINGTLKDVTAFFTAKVAAEAASEAKSNFVGNMSHELRTPLNAILGFSEIMETELFGPLGDPRYRGYAADVRRSGQHLLSVINDILSVSGLDAGKVELQEEVAVDVGELIRKTAFWLKGQASGQRIEMRISIASGISALRGDERLLTQSLLNLLSNAVKFTPREGLIEIVAVETEAGGITMSVRDTGMGMTSDQIARIGEPFIQFDKSLSRKFDGTGLGLSITKKLVELHGGQLEVESAPGLGTTMSINLPPERSVRQIFSSASAACA